jgi:hypothetical protein
MKVLKFLKVGLVLFVFFFSLVVFCYPVRGDSTIVISLKGTKIQKKVSSWKALRDANIVKQKYDYSCGAASVATLLTFYFGEKTSEKEVIKLILKNRNKTDIEKITKEGFSLLDLKEAVEKLGYFGGAYRLKLKHLKKLRTPVIVFIQSRGYKHFAVFKGIRGNRVYLADPSRGNIRMAIYRFKEQWQGIILVIDKKESSPPSDFLILPSAFYASPEIFTIKFLSPIIR